MAGCLELADSAEGGTDGGGGAGGVADAAWPDGPGAEASSGGSATGGSGGTGASGGVPAGGGSGGAPPSGGGGSATGGSGGSAMGGSGGVPSGGGFGGGVGGGGGSGGSCAPIAKIAGPLTPSSAANLSLLGTEPWVSPGSALLKDAAYAHVAVKQAEVSNYLAVTGFGPQIPGNATITGVVVTVERQDVNKILDAGVRLVSGGSAVGLDHSSNVEWKTQIDEVVTYGGTTDTWGLSLSPSQVSASDFGFALAAKSAEPTNVYPQSARVDAVTLTVYYSVPGC